MAVFPRVGCACDRPLTNATDRKMRRRRWRWCILLKRDPERRFPCGDTFGLSAIALQLPAGQAFPGGNALVMRLPDRIKREKGVWWMPWRQEAMKDAALCDKPGGGESTL